MVEDAPPVTAMWLYLSHVAFKHTRTHPNAQRVTRVSAQSMSTRKPSRCCELLGPRWRDVDLNAARLSVKQQYTRQGKGLGFGTTKSKKSIRTIDVDQETIALLHEQQERQRFDRRAWGTGYRADLDLVFCRPGGSAAHATLLLEPDVDVKTVSGRLGHDTVQTPLGLYGHVHADDAVQCGGTIRIAA